MQEVWVPSLDQEDPLEKGIATHFSIFAWEITWTQEPGVLQSVGSQKIWTWLRDQTTTYLLYPWEIPRKTVRISKRSEALNLGECQGWWFSTSKCCCCSVTKSCPALCDPKKCSTPGLTVLQCILEFSQTQVHWVCDAIQPSHPLSPGSPTSLNLSQHESLFQWIGILISWPNYWSFSLSISPSNEYSRLISFMIDWFDIHTVQGTLKSLL